MRDAVSEAKRIIDSLDKNQARMLVDYIRSKFPHPLEEEWQISADFILDAIHRSTDITKRGIRGIIAECVFVQKVLPQLTGWQAVEFTGDLPYDFKLQEIKSDRSVTIQVKLQRIEKGVPLKQVLFGDHFIVEVQRTRSGEVEDLADEPNGTELSALGSGDSNGDKDGEAGKKKARSTRPYEFGQFDILAVNMHPSSGDWTRFMYTVGAWLLPRSDEKLIRIMNPVSPIRNDVWTDSLGECIEWFFKGEKKRIVDLEVLQKANKERQVAERKRRAEARRLQKLKENGPAV